MCNRKSLSSVLLAACLMSVVSGAYAIPVLHKLTLEVTEVLNQPVPECADPTIPTFGCDNAVGDRHVGSFSVDSSLLALEGDNLPASVSNFFLQIGDVIWDQANPEPASQFAGFRNADGISGLSSFDVDVHGGAITDLSGGVHGGADVPFVDFSTGFAPGPNSFLALGLADVTLVGTLQVSRVPESGMMALMSIGLLALGCIALRKSQGRNRCA